MKKHTARGILVALGSTIGLLAPSSGMELYAAEPPLASVQTPAAPAVLALDVVMSAKGEVRGAAVNANGSPSAKAKVTLNQGTGKDGMQTTTDEAGRFVFQNVRPGVYGVSVVGEKGRSEKIVRVWRQEIAPPAATPVAVVKLQDGQTEDVVRGQAGAVVTEETPTVVDGGGTRSRFLLGTLVGAGIGFGAGAIAFTGDNNNNSDNNNTPPVPNLNALIPARPASP